MSESYVFAETQLDAELERLMAVQTVCDAATHRNLERVGIRAGWECLEVGAGAGSIMHWLRDRVGERGRVVAVDRDPRFIQAVRRSRLEVRQLDIVTEPLEAASFDLVHARFVLMHISEREQAIANLVQALRPGGWLLIEDADFATALPPDQSDASQAVQQVFDATRQFYVSIGVDPYLGRKLPAWLQQLGLQNIETATEIGFVQGGSARARIWQLAVEHLRQPLLDTGIPSEGAIDRFLNVTTDPTAWSLDYTTVAAWGQKP